VSTCSGMLDHDYCESVQLQCLIWDL
jgi:hypothetical protein